MTRQTCALPLLSAVLALCAPSGSFAQLRIVSMNASNAAGSFGPRPGMQTILNSISTTMTDDPTIAGNSGIAKRIDVLLLQEFHGPADTGAGYASLLNTMYGTTTFSYGTLAGSTTGSGTQGIIYNSATVNLLSSATVGTSSTSGQPRQTLRYQLRPAGYGSAADVYVYNGHWKAGDDSTSRNRRNTEAQAIRADVAANVPANANVLYVGDFNTYNGSEACLATITAPGTGQAFDPINRMTWSASNADRNIHTQSPFDTTSRITGFTGGGMDSRFDWQMVNGPMKNAGGVTYIPNSYQAWGNNGSHALSGPIDSGTGAPASVLQAMSESLDHLPIVADYAVPARMSVSVGVVPPRVIQGASVTVPVNVSNSANVVAANGADKLAYTVGGSGAVTGSATGANLAALSPANVHALSLSTATPGIATGTVSVTATSEAAADATFSGAVSTQVLEHAHPTLDVNTIDFGIIVRRGATRSATFTISNAPGTNPTATLDLDSIDSLGDASAFLTDASTFANLPAGTSSASKCTFNVSFAPTRGGQYRVAYTLNTSDEDLPGATSASSVVRVTAIVAAAGDTDLSGFIDAPDLAAIDAGLSKSGVRWRDGDFTGDGIVDFADVAMADASFVVQSDTGGANGTVARAIRYLSEPMRDASSMEGAELHRVASDFERFQGAYAHAFLVAVPDRRRPHWPRRR